MHSSDPIHQPPLADYITSTNTDTNFSNNKHLS